MLFKDKEFFDIVKKKEKMPTWWNGRHEGLKVEMTIVIKFECIGEKSLCISRLIR